MRTPDDFLKHLAAHRDSDDRLIEGARKLTPLEIETSTDPKVVRMRRMIYSVQGEIHRMRGFVRLAPLGKRVLCGRMSPDHEIGFEVADFFAKRFPGTIILLGDETRSWATLLAEGGFLRSRGQGMTRTLEELGRLMDVGSDEDDVADLWEVYYNSQDQPRKDGRRPFGGLISKRSLKSAGMETERGRGNKRLGDFI
jgi:probable DNA metabolism protein